MPERVNESLRARYEAIPYVHGPAPHSHPARMAGVARLLGVPAAEPDRCRVLELGCGSGLNLLAMAERLTGSEFVGVDVADTHIVMANRAAAACEIRNARFIRSDLLDLTPEADSYDFVIAHGVYSWVPEKVRDRLLAICAAVLRPNGLAYVSYNTQPGWGVLGGLRQILMDELRRAGGYAEQQAHALRLLSALETSFANVPGAYAAMMRELIAGMRQKPIALVMHDELSEVNDVCTFLEFTAHAGRHGLHFLSEAHFAAMPLEHLPPQARDALATLNLDALRAQQMVDLIGNRRLRASLLTRQAVPRVPALETSVVRQCVLSSNLRVDVANVDLAPDRELEVAGLPGVRFRVHEPVLKAFLAVLAAAAPERMHFAEVVEEVRRRLSAAGLAAEVDEELLCHTAVRLFTINQVDLLLAGSGDWLERPEPSRLMEFQAQQGWPVITRWHELRGD